MRRRGSVSDNRSIVLQTGKQRLILDFEGLYTTVQAEYETINHSQKRPVTSSPQTSAQVSQWIAPLREAVENETAFDEDVFQARVCLGWLHWTMGELEKALAQLPSEYDSVVEQLSGKEIVLAGWTHVSVVKGVYLRGRLLILNPCLSPMIDAYRSGTGIFGKS